MEVHDNLTHWLISTQVAECLQRQAPAERYKSALLPERDARAARRLRTAGRRQFRADEEAEERRRIVGEEKEEEEKKQERRGRRAVDGRFRKEEEEKEEEVVNRWGIKLVKITSAERTRRRAPSVSSA